MSNGALQRLPIVERLEMLSMAEPNTGCVLYLGTLSSKGYGVLFVQGKRRRAHTVAYELARGPIPPGLEPDHKCRVRSCINDLHLEPVTHKVNLLRGDTVAARNKSRTHCPQEHPYTEENTYVRKNGRRDCRTCKALSDSRYRQHRRAQPRQSTKTRPS